MYGSVTLVCDLWLAPNVIAKDASVVAFTQAPILFAPGLRTFGPWLLDGSTLAVFYGTEADARQEVYWDDIPFLSIGKLNPPLEGGWRFRVSGRDWSPYFYGGVRGMYIGVGQNGSYGIDAEGPLRGLLGPTETSTAFAVSSPGSFFPEAYFIGPTPKPTPTPEQTPTLPPTEIAESGGFKTPGPGSGNGNLDGSQRGGGSSALSSGALIGIVIVVVAAVAIAVVVGWITWRHFRGGSAGGSPKAAQDDLSDELADGRFD
jgi:hypothetical protein